MIGALLLEVEYVPLFVQFPLTVNARLFWSIVAPAAIETLPLTVNVPLLFSVRTGLFVEPSVSELTVAVEESVGSDPPVKLASPMTTSLVDVGTPLVQFADVVQLVLVVPFQDVDCPNSTTTERRLIKHM